MRRDELQSLARVKRELRLIQRSIDVLGSTPTAYHWLTTPCAALRGKAPQDIRYDVGGARCVAIALRRRAVRQRKVRSAGLHAFEDEAALTAWLWKKCRQLGSQRPAMLLDTDRGAREVLAILARTRRPAGQLTKLSSSRKNAMCDGTEILTGNDHSKPTSLIVSRLIEILGSRLCAVIGDVKRTRTLRSWIDGERPAVGKERILRFALRVAEAIAERFGGGAAQAWFQGANRTLGDKAPAIVLKRAGNAGDVEALNAERNITLAVREFLDI
jgi:uncharacterized protein (DUF2384 family)